MFSMEVGTECVNKINPVAKQTVIEKGRPTQ
jgi:hypothetical protein